MEESEEDDRGEEDTESGVEGATTDMQVSTTFCTM